MKIHSPRRALCLFAIGMLLMGPGPAPRGEDAAPPVPWTQADSKLANHYIQLLERDPAYGKVLDLLWRLYEKKEQTPLLLDYFGKAAASGPAVARVIHAHLLRKSGDIEAARAGYDAVIEAEPENLPALTALAQIADEQKRWAKALSLYNRLADLTPASDEASLSIRKRRADLMRLQGQPQEAIAEWKALLADYPDRADLRSEITALLLEAGETGTAADLLKGLAGNADNRTRLNALLELTRLHEFSGDFDAGVASTREAMALLHFRSLEYGQLFESLVRFHERFDRLDELEQSLATAAGGGSPSEQALADLVAFYRLTADPAKEETAVARLAALLPGSIEPRLRLAELQMQNDRYEEAAATLDGLVATGETPTLPWILRRALVDLQSKGRETATKRLQDAIASGAVDGNGRREILDFARSHFLDELVESLLASADWTGSTEEEAPGPVELARFLHERGRVDQAVATLETYAASAEGGTLDQAARRHQVGLVYKELGLNENARQAIESALKLAPENLDYRSTLADVLVASKKIDGAIAELERIRTGRSGLKDRAEVDQRLFSLLRGHFSSEAETPPAEEGVLAGGAIQSLAQYRRIAAAANQAASSAVDEPPPQELVNYYESIKKAANESPSTDSRYRAAWWAMKLQDNQECFQQLNLANEEAGKPVVEIEKMLLQLAEQNERTTLMVRHLATLIEIDPENADDYRQRRALVRFELGFEDEAVRELRELAAKPDAPMATLNALAKLYQRQGSPGKQVDVWERAFRDADLFEKRNIIKQLSSAYIESGKPEEALRSQIELLESESDPVQRRKQLDIQISVAQSHYLLDWMRDRYSELASKHPFDRFYPEALARVLRAGNHDEEAYTAMKKAYYLSGRNEELLGDLGELSDQLGDLDAAIYFRRQLLAIGQGDSLENWKELVRMLEKDLRVSEADALRRRLETKFGSDPDFLAELTDHYLKSGQPRDAERTLSQLVSLRTWDLEARFRLGLLQAQRQEVEAAYATFTKILADTADRTVPDGFGKGLLPLIRVGAEPGSPRGAVGDDIEALVFTIEAFPYSGGNLREELADALQAERPEFAPVPKEPHLIRLRSIEEAAALAARLGRVPAWLGEWKRPDRPLHERLWATRHAGDDGSARKAFAALLKELSLPQSPVDHLFQAYAWLLTGDLEGFLAWSRSEGDGAEGSRSTYATMATLLLFKDRPTDPLCDIERIRRTFAALEVTETVANHVFDELRKSGRHLDAYRIGETFAGSVLAEVPTFHFELSRSAGLAGLLEERKQWLERSLFSGLQERRGRMGRHTFAALTELLALYDSDTERSDCLRRFASATNGISPGPRETLERELYLRLASKDTSGVLERIEDLVALTSGPWATRVSDPADWESALVQNWQDLSRLLHDYRDRLRLGPAEGEVFADAFALAPPMQALQGSTAAVYEQFEIDRQMVRLEHRNPAERDAVIRDLRASIREPDSRMELAKTLESLGYHREAVPVYLEDAELRGRDYAPMQGLFDAAADAFDPAPALDLIARIQAGDFPAPPGLTVDYLNDKHSRFLLTDANFGLLERLSQAPTGAPNAPPISNRSYLPFQDALVEGYRRFNEDEKLLALLGGLKERGEITYQQMLLGAEVLSGHSRPGEALEWLKPVALDPTEAVLQRRALQLALKIEGGDPQKNPELLRELALASLERQPVPVTLELAKALHGSGAGDEAAGVLRLLRRGTSNRPRRLLVSTALLELQQASGTPWEGLRDDLENVFLDLGIAEEPAPKSGGAEGDATPAPTELPRSTSYRFVEWFLATPSEGRSEALSVISCPEESLWLRDLLLAHFGGRLEAVARAAWSDRAPGRESDDALLEILPAFGEAGIETARVLVESGAMPGTSHFAGQPETQIAFFHRIGDRLRLCEVHSQLMREARSDLFHQLGLEDWQPTLATRRHLPSIFAAAGEPDLAASLYRAYDASIANYQWPHVAFLNDYAEFLIENENFAEAESLLHRVLRKSIRLDLRLVPKLYQAWGRLDQWEARTRPLQLTRGREVLLRHWAAALAEGRDMREIRDPW